MTNHEKIVDALSEMVRCTCKDTIANGQNSIDLRENQLAAKGRLDKVTIINIPTPFAVYHPDLSRPELCPFLEVGIPQKACDAIIITEHSSKTHMIICELKCGSKQGVIDQLKNTAAICDFLISLVEQHKELDCANIVKRYVVIGARTLKKKKTRQTDLKAGSSPKRPRELSVKNKAQIYLKELCLPY